MAIGFFSNILILILLGYIFLISKLSIKLSSSNSLLLHEFLKKKKIFFCTRKKSLFLISDSFKILLFSTSMCLMLKIEPKSK